MPPEPQTLAQIQAEQNASSTEAASIREEQEQAFIDWHNENMPGADVVMSAPGDPTPDGTVRHQELMAAPVEHPQTKAPAHHFTAAQATPRPASVLGRLALWLSGAGMVAGLAGYLVHRAQDNVRVEQKRREGLLLSELPVGVEEQWVQHANASVRTILSRHGMNYVVDTVALSGKDEGILIASIRRGYVLKCDGWSMSITLYFSGGAETEVAVLDFQGRSGGGLEPPPLTVDAQSIAARKLKRRLCLEVANRIDAIGTE